MGLFERNKRIIILLVCTLFVLCYIMPVEAKTNEEIYQEKLAVLKPDDVKGHYDLGEWCLKNKLPEQSKAQFNKVLELDSKHKKAQQNIEKLIQSEKDAKIAEIIKKYGPYKGVLDKAGADTEKLPWENAREKETEHFIVKTNLSVDALNDICCLLECAYLNYQDIFGFDTPKEKLLVMVAKNKDEFQKICYELTEVNVPGEDGRFEPALSPRNKSRQDHLLSFYNILDRKPMASNLLHEYTHYALESVRQKHNCHPTPIWLNEGWATYCESSKLEGKRLARGSPEGLVTNVINQGRLVLIKAAFNNRTYIKLKDFINRAQSDYDFPICYPEGWSLIYFLLNGQGGKYKAGLQTYMEAWEKDKIVTDNDYTPQDKPAHLKLFEESIGMPMDQLEKEWKEYILNLK